MTDEIPETGAVFTFGKSHFADNEPSHFFIKSDPIVALSCGDEHSAVICQNGRVFVFGANAWGQLGLGHKDEVTRPSCVKWLKPHRAMFVACGRAHTVFVTDTNAIYTVGCNDEGQLGTGDVEPHTVPQFVEIEGDITGITQVSAGSNHTAILTADGRVFVCGSNTEGQLGLGEDTRSCLKFTELKFVEKIAFVECGYYHTVFITSNGGVFVTGDNENQKLGIPHTSTTIYAPEVLPINVPIKNACCGANHTFLLSMDESQILAFGSNSNGQLGLAKDIENVTEPTEINMDTLFDGFQLKLVACGAMHTAFVTDNGLLYTCGEARHNKLCLEEVDNADNSNEAISNQYTPKRVTAMNGFIVDNVACGGCHTLLTATKGSNADFTNNDFNIIDTQNRQISITELPPLQKVPIMNKTDEITAEDVTNSNVEETMDNVNGNVEETGSINSLEANVSGSHIVNINDLECDNSSIRDIPHINKDEVDKHTFDSGVLGDIGRMNRNIENIESDVEKNIKNSIINVKSNVEDTITNFETDTDHRLSDIKNKASDFSKNIENMASSQVESIGKAMENTTENVKQDITGAAEDLKHKVVEKTEVVEEFIKKAVPLSPGSHERNVLEIPDKISETANSPPPKTPIIQDLLHIPDLSRLSPNLSKHSDDGQKTGQSDNETLPCDSDKSSPQTGKTKMQAVMPIVRSEDNIDCPEGHHEEGDVVVNKEPEKGRFARMFQSLKDKENSCMSRGKVIEEHVVENVNKGIDHVEETVHKVEETVETEIRNHTNSRTCTLL